MYFNGKNIFKIISIMHNASIININKYKTTKISPISISDKWEYALTGKNSIMLNKVIKIPKKARIFIEIKFLKFII